MSVKTIFFQDMHEEDLLKFYQKNQTSATSEEEYDIWDDGDFHHNNDEQFDYYDY